MRGAGVLFITNDKRCLFLQRNGESDWPLHWCLPGGRVEDGETTEQCAVRETIEELGRMPDYLLVGPRQRLLTTNTPRSPAPDAETVEFTTYIQRVADIFEPDALGGEHTGFAWAPSDEPPQPIHPGVAIALKKLTWNELDVARAIRDGILASPQIYENMALFAIRITGTGTAYRRKHDEFVLRKPAIYLNDEFLARCNGLPVIVEHPKGAKLDSREFAERTIGAVMLPYIKGDEVWGIARIYDEEAAQMMQLHQLSTSPSVVLRKGENLKLGLEDGKTLLVEGEPHLLDHVAICPIGVWDKGADPSGVLVEAIGDSAMADTKEAEAKKEEKKDSVKGDEHIEPAKQSSGGESGGVELNKMLSKLDACMTKMDAVADSMGKRMDAIGSRMDAMEESKKDSAKKDEDEKKEEKKDAKKDAEAEKPGKEGASKEVVADKRKDADEKKEEKKEDAMADSDPDVRKAIADLMGKIDTLGTKMPKALNDADYNAMADYQARADNVAVQFGDRAPRPLDGESPAMYRKRLAGIFKKHSKLYKDIDLTVIPDAAFEPAEAQIYADAMTAAQSPDQVPVGTLRAVTRPMGNGANMTKFIGHPSAWMNNFAPNRRFVTLINSKPQHPGV